MFRHLALFIFTVAKSIMEGTRYPRDPSPTYFSDPRILNLANVSSGQNYFDCVHCRILAHRMGCALPTASRT